MDKAEISPKQTFRMPVSSTLTNNEAATSSEFRFASSFPVPSSTESVRLLSYGWASWIFPFRQNMFQIRYCLILAGHYLIFRE